MKTTDDEIGRLILLENSHELSDSQRGRLEVLLQDNADNRQLQNEILELMQAAKSTESETAISAAVRENILFTAKQKLRKHDIGRSQRVRESFVPLWRPALVATAAALFLLAVIPPLSRIGLDPQPTLGHSSESSYPDDINIDVQLLILNEDVAWALLEYASIADMDKDLEELADELIKLAEVEI